MECLETMDILESLDLKVTKVPQDTMVLLDFLVHEVSREIKESVVCKEIKETRGNLVLKESREIWE
jgi:hypothetical protein